MIRFSTGDMALSPDNPLNYFAFRWEKPDVSPSYVSLWPVPQRQIDVNENLEQNPGY
jgi:hypothetical protein